MSHLTFLRQALQQGKLSHAYLLSGNDEEGQKALVRDFLFSLLGYEEKKVHGDVALVRPEKGTISIEQVREFKEHLAMSPWQSSWKVGVVERADAMNLLAQSAFLKLLEEPRGNVLLFLLCSHPALLLETIRSRAQELRMYAFPEKFPNGGLDITKLHNSSLAARFEEAKMLAQDEEQAALTLQCLLRQARIQLVSSVTGKEQQGAAVWRQTVSIVQEVMRTQRETQGNTRFALERAFLAF